MGIVVDCKNINKNYGRKKVLEDVSICVEEGKIIGLLGPNGSGKTTLIKIITGMINSYDGTIEFDNGNIKSSDKDYLVNMRVRVSYCPDKMCYENSATVGKIVDFYETFFRDFDKERALKELSNRKIDLEEKIGNLSKGTAERLKVILTMSRKARLYILDEPFDGIDVLARDSIIKMIITFLPEDAAIIISTHNLAEIEKVLDEAVFLKEGRILFQKSVEDIRQENGRSLMDTFKDCFKE